MERDGLDRASVNGPERHTLQVFELTPEVEQLLSQACVPLLSQFVRVFTGGRPAKEVNALSPTPIARLPPLQVRRLQIRERTLAYLRQGTAVERSISMASGLGSDLVPDYMTSVHAGGYYGWPCSYYGAHVDERVKPPRPDLVATAVVPDYALGPHTASLGLAYVHGAGFPSLFDRGRFLGQHRSWNRKPPGVDEKSRTSTRLDSKSRCSLLTFDQPDIDRRRPLPRRRRSSPRCDDLAVGRLDGHEQAIVAAMNQQEGWTISDALQRRAQLLDTRRRFAVH
jgi:hypothetical protein